MPVSCRSRHHPGTAQLGGKRTLGVTACGSTARLPASGAQAPSLLDHLVGERERRSRTWVAGRPDLRHGPGRVRRAAAPAVDSAPRSRCVPPDCQGHRQSNSCRCRSGPKSARFVFMQPAAGGEGLNHAAIETPRGAIVEVLETGGLAQPGKAQPLAERGIVALSSKPRRSQSGRPCCSSKRLGHAGQPQAPQRCDRGG